MAAASLALAAALLFVARPVAVLVSTPGSTLTGRERLFLSWAGLRGAVPIVLATFVESAGVGAVDAQLLGDGVGRLLDAVEERGVQLHAGRASAVASRKDATAFRNVSLLIQW